MLCKQERVRMRFVGRERERISTQMLSAAFADLGQARS